MPPPPALEGVLAPNNRLSEVRRLDLSEIVSTEDIAIAADGSFYMSGIDGALYRIPPSPDPYNPNVERVIQVSEERLLGLDWYDENTLAIGAASGLFSLDLETLNLQRLSIGSPRRAFGFINDLQVDPDGGVYFTDSASHWEYMGLTPARSRTYELLANIASGVLYYEDPVTGASHIIEERLHYANGVSVSTDRRSVFVSETTHFRVRQIAARGLSGNRNEYLVENLPGNPDGLVSDGMCRLFIATTGPRRGFTRLLRRSPFWTKMLMKLGWTTPLVPAEGRGMILVVDERSGEILDSFQSQDGTVKSIANIVLTGAGGLWFTSDTERSLAYLDLPPDYDRPLPGCDVPASEVNVP